jgi:1-deoxy-D-xylulose-5-phosphate reductoisomerase
MIRRRVTVLGSTGSVGSSTLELMEQAEAAGTGAFEVEALTGGANIARLAEQARRWKPTLALANKESLVCCGPALLERVRRAGGSVIPVDSEHSAIFQVFPHHAPHQVQKLILTASGGPFRGMPRESLADITPEQAVAHPNWSMGAKISVDSATMANKGLEAIEAAYLFDMPADRIDVVVHPESIIHSLVEYVDGSTLAQLGPPDMKTPIACALAWPDRIAWPAPKLDLAALGRLTFEAPDETRFPCLGLARQALRAGGSAPIVFNAANEVAALAFLDRRLGFLNIAAVVADTLSRVTTSGVDSGSRNACDAALAVDVQARREAESIVRGLAAAA